MSLTALTSQSRDLTAGAEWPLSVLVLDDREQLVTVAVTASVTDPAGTITAPAVEDFAPGVGRLLVYPSVPGRWLAHLSTVEHGSCDFAAWVAAPVTGEGMPTLHDLVGDRATSFGYLGRTSWSDSDVQDALDAEAGAQRDVCAVPAAYPPSLREALFRRVAANLARRNLPLAVAQGDAESGGPVAPPTLDPEVRRLEKPYPKLTVG